MSGGFGTGDSGSGTGGGRDGGSVRDGGGDGGGADLAEQKGAESAEWFSRANGWYALSQVHGRIETHIERSVQARHDLSAREYSLLDVLSHQHDGDGGHLRMNQVADAVVLSQSATTRLVTRLEDRGLLERYLCPTDRRGIYTNVTSAGLALLAEARPTHDAALLEAMADAGRDERLAPLVETLERLNRAAGN